MQPTTVDHSVLLGFSGGIDSMSAARFLIEQGHRVTLLTLNLFEGAIREESLYHFARQHDVPLRIESVHHTFRNEVINYFIERYRQGETPAPCTRCNSQIKWKILNDTARRDGFESIATGHYFRIHRETNRCLVRQAKDTAKDQSYYLWDLPQSCLQRTLTPMGEQIKSEVAALLPSTVRSAESMGICFLRGEHFSDYLRQHIGSITPGALVDLSGNIIGTHDGYPLYTTGQKKGLHAHKKESGWVVVSTDPDHNQVIVGRDADLYSHFLRIKDFRITSPDRLFSDRAWIKIRGIGRNPEGFVRVRQAGHMLEVDLEHPAWAPAKGQPVVFYYDDLVVGGGILDDYQ